MRGFKVLFIALLACGVIAISGCKPDKTNNGATFTLQIKGKYGNQPFALNTANTDPQGRFVVPLHLMFYLSHINLIKTDGSLVKVSDVAYFRFDDPSILTVSVNNIQGDFTGIKFGCGLDSIQNATDPTPLSAPNPLSGDYDMSWGMLQYRFEVLEAKWDTAVMPIMRNALVYHIGTNPTYRQTQVNKTFSVGSTPYTLDLYLDVEKVFYNTTTNETLDIVTQSSSSSEPTDDPTILKTFPDNFSNAFTF